MQIMLIVALGIAVLACIFALQNSQVVAVSFLAFKYEASMALILLGTFALGALVALLTSVPAMIQGRLRLAELKTKLKSLEKQSSDGPGGEDEGEERSS